MRISVCSLRPRKSIGYNTEQEIDNRIASIEFQLCTESVPLKAKAFRVVSAEGRTKSNWINWIFKIVQTSFFQEAGFDVCFTTSIPLGRSNRFLQQLNIQISTGSQVLGEEIRSRYSAEKDGVSSRCFQKRNCISTGTLFKWAGCMWLARRRICCQEEKKLLAEIQALKKNRSKVNQVQQMEQQLGGIDPLGVRVTVKTHNAYRGYLFKLQPLTLANWSPSTANS